MTILGVEVRPPESFCRIAEDQPLGCLVDEILKVEVRRLEIFAGVRVTRTELPDMRQVDGCWNYIQC